MWAAGRAATASLSLRKAGAASRNTHRRDDEQSHSDVPHGFYDSPIF